MTCIQNQTLQQHHIEAPRVFDGILTGLMHLPWALVRMLVQTLLTWQRRADERDRLSTLDPRLLSDMGITEASAAREAAIPFWRLK